MERAEPQLKFGIILYEVESQGTLGGLFGVEFLPSTTCVFPIMHLSGIEGPYGGGDSPNASAKFFRMEIAHFDLTSHVSD